ncbi:MAG: hypothetical protein EP347_01130 [Alphaproteobacteria bacterium]|nr:MAG: hypothetical protein EP347_01130 [Alphaproteobacteria bacterium]
MTNPNSSQVHWSFWIIAILALAWNAMSAINFVVQMNPDMIAVYRENEQMIIEGRPIWATASFAVSAFGGCIGAGLLLLRNRFAYQALVASMIGTVFAVAHSLTLGIPYGLGEIVGIILLPLIIAGYLVNYTKRALAKSWIS